MSMLLWVLQILLAVHTLIGALWKFSNSTQTVPSLAVIPHSIWLGMSGFEILCSVALIVPVFNQHLRILAPIGSWWRGSVDLLLTEGLC